MYEVKGRGQRSRSKVWSKVKVNVRSMFGIYQSIKLPLYLGYMFKVKVEVKGQGQRSGPQVRVKGRDQMSMSGSNIRHIAANKVTNPVLTLQGLNENEKKKKKNMVKP